MCLNPRSCLHIVRLIRTPNLIVQNVLSADRAFTDAHTAASPSLAATAVQVTAKRHVPLLLADLASVAATTVLARPAALPAQQQDPPVQIPAATLLVAAKTATAPAAAPTTAAARQSVDRSSIFTDHSGKSLCLLSALILTIKKLQKVR